MCQREEWNIPYVSCITSKRKQRLGPHGKHGKHAVIILSSRATIGRSSHVRECRGSPSQRLFSLYFAYWVLRALGTGWLSRMVVEEVEIVLRLLFRVGGSPVTFRAEC